MTTSPPAQRAKPTPAIIVASYTLAALSFLLASSSGDLPVSDSIRVPLDGVVILAWCGLALWTVWWSRWRAWPVLLGAPFALFPPLFLILTIGPCFFGAACWVPG